MWNKDGIYLFSNTESENHFVFSGKEVANKTLSIELEYLFDGEFSEIQHVILNDFKRHRLEKMRI